MDQVREMRDRVAAGGKATIPVNIDFEGLTGTHYKDTVRFRVPTAMDMITIGVYTAKYLQKDLPAGSVDPGLIPDFVKDLAEAIVTIDLLVNKREAPDWVTQAQDSEDPDAIVHLWRLFNIQKRIFRRAGAKPATGSGEAPTGAPEVLVPQAVQPAAD
jgi:hypothetical protein